MELPQPRELSPEPLRLRARRGKLLAVVAHSRASASPEAPGPGSQLRGARLHLQYEASNRLDLAQTFLCKSLRIRGEVLERSSPRLPEAYFNLGLVHMRKLEYAAALDKFRQVHELNAATLHGETPMVAKNLLCMGEAQRELGQAEAAVASFSTCLRIRERCLGKQHADTRHVCKELLVKAQTELKKSKRAR